jgi:hypothetical protein
MGRKKLEAGKGKTENLHVRLSPAWRDWVARFAESREMTASDLVKWALREVSKRRFEPPPRGD